MTDSVTVDAAASDLSGARPRRSVLYMPGSNPRALEKAKTLAADALILDLEDAVAPAEKDAARGLARDAVRGGGYGGRELIIRVNGLDTDWGEADVAAASEAAPHAVLLPKANSADAILELDALLHRCGAPDHVAIWAMMETPQGVLNAAAIAASTPRLQGFVMGTNDLVKDMRAAFTPGREPLLTSLSLCVLAARSYDVAVIDGVYNAFKDEDGLRAECAQGKAMGFDGKTLIHPAQVAAANDIFGPSVEDVALAEKYVAAYEAAVAEGKGVAVVDGRIVENLHVEQARRILAQAAAIAALSGDAA